MRSLKRIFNSPEENVSKQLQARRAQLSHCERQSGLQPTRDTARSIGLIRAGYEIQAPEARFHVSKHKEQVSLLLFRLKRSSRRFEKRAR